MPRRSRAGHGGDGADSDQGKEDSGNVNPYEVLLMLDPELPDERQSEILARAQEIITKDGGTWHGNEPWGRRKLAYEIRKKKEGIYTLIRFKPLATVLPHLSRRYQLNEGLLRHMTVLYEAPPPPHIDTRIVDGVAPPEPVVRET